MGLFTEHDETYDNHYYAGIERGYLISSELFAVEVAKLCGKMETSHKPAEEKLQMCLDTLVTVNRGMSKNITRTGEKINAEYRRSKDSEPDNSDDVQCEQVREDSTSDSPAGG